MVVATVMVVLISGTTVAAEVVFVAMLAHLQEPETRLRRRTRRSLLMSGPSGRLAGRASPGPPGVQGKKLTEKTKVRVWGLGFRFWGLGVHAPTGTTGPAWTQ